MKKINLFLQQLLEHCGLDPKAVEIKVEEKDENITIQINLPEEESGIIIGFHGEVLEAIQRMVRVIFFNQFPDKKITVNINDYRERRREKLERLTYDSARKVLDTGRPFTFRSFLTPYERYIVHSTLSSNPDFDQLESISQGDGKTRRLTIQFK